MARKRVLFAVEAMGGGVFTYIVSLANRLANTYDVYLAYATRPQTPENYRDYFDSRVHLIPVRHFTREISPKEDPKALLELVRLRREIRPDIIHLHSSKAGVLGRIAFGAGKTPLFYTPHGYSFLMENASPSKQKMYRLIESALAKTRCVTISCSEGEHRETLRLTRRAEKINNGIDLEEIDRELAAIPETSAQADARPYTVFTLGRICYQKNPELFNQIAERMPELRFVWIGDGELCEQLNAPNIEVTGWVDRASALRIASRADCFLLPSRWEGLPISLLEAMYMKKSCVVSDIIGNHDVIQNDTNGFLCTEPDEFVKAIRAAQQPETAARIQEHAYQDIMSEYNASAMAQRYAELYEKYSTKSNG